MTRQLLWMVGAKVSGQRNNHGQGANEGCRSKRISQMSVRSLQLFGMATDINGVPVLRWQVHGCR